MLYTEDDVQLVVIIQWRRIDDMSIQAELQSLNHRLPMPNCTVFYGNIQKAPIEIEWER